MITKVCAGCNRHKTDYLSRFRHADWICRDCCFKKPLTESRQSEYNSWIHLKERCLNPNSSSFSRYGGRGIQVYGEWIKSFDKFYAHMGPKPSPKHSIDRINNDGNYEPGNVRWAMPKEQANNCSRNSFIEHNGERLTPMQWAERIGISRPAFIERLNKKSPPERLFAPRANMGKGALRLITFGDETRNLKQWADELNTSPRSLGRLIDQSLTLEEIRLRLSAVR